MGRWGPNRSKRRSGDGKTRKGRKIQGTKRGAASKKRGVGEAGKKKRRKKKKKKRKNKKSRTKRRSVLEKHEGGRTQG